MTLTKAPASEPPQRDKSFSSIPMARREQTLSNYVKDFARGRLKELRWHMDNHPGREPAPVPCGGKGMSDETRIRAIRATLRKIDVCTFGTNRALHDIYDIDRKAWSSIVDQKNEWEDWAARFKWEHGGDIDPTCRPSTVRFRVNRINSIETTISVLSWDVWKYRDMGAYHSMMLLFDKWFIELQSLDTYLTFGDDDIRAFRKKKEARSQ